MRRTIHLSVLRRSLLTERPLQSDGSGELQLSHNNARPSIVLRVSPYAGSERWWFAKICTRTYPVNRPDSLVAHGGLLTHLLGCRANQAMTTEFDLQQNR